MAEWQLTPDQLKAAELLATGMSKSKVAAEVGCNRVTLYVWRTLPQFIKAYNQACARAHRETIALVQRTTKRATGTLVKALNNPDANVAVRAALGLLANGWKASEHYVLDERVTKLEESERGQSGPPGDAAGADPQPKEEGPAPDVVSIQAS